MKYYDHLHKIIIAGIIAIFCGCSNNVRNNTQETDVNVDVKGSNPITDFITSQRHIVLETNDTSIIKHVNRLIMDVHTLYIQDGNEILAFSEDGTYQQSYNHYGQGPEEYLEIKSFRVNHDKLYILDKLSQRIMVYELSDGKYDRTIKLPYEFVDFWVYPDGEIVLASGNYNSSMSNFVWIDSTTGDIQSTQIAYNNAHTVELWDYVPFAGILNDELIVNIPFGMTNYQLTKHSAIPYFNFSFNTDAQLPKVPNENIDISEFSDQTRNTSVVRQLGYYAHTSSSNYLCFKLFGSIGGFMDYLVKFNNDGEQEAITMIGAEIFKEYPYLLSIHSIIDNNLISITNSATLLRLDASNDSSYWTERGLTEDSNPVVSIYTLK